MSPKNDIGRPATARSFGALRRCFLNKLNAGLIAPPPLDAGLAPGGVQRQQQDKRFADFAVDHQPGSGRRKVNDAARPGRKAPLQPNPSRRAESPAARFSPFGALSCEHASIPARTT
jgi:hypothetical protein